MWPFTKFEAAAKEGASKALAAIPARLPRWAALAIAVLLVAALGSALESCRTKRASKAISRQSATETQAIKDAARAGDERHAGELLELRNRLAVSEAREASTRGELERLRRERATPWPRPTSAAALADRFRALGYQGVCR